MPRSAQKTSTSVTNTVPSRDLGSQRSKTANPATNLRAPVVAPVGEGQDDFGAVYWLMRRMGDRWTIPILIALRRGPLRFTKLKRTLDPVSQRMLTLSLRRLEQDNLSYRVKLAGHPPPVVYGLTPLGSALIGHLTQFESWLVVHRPVLVQTQN